MSPVSMLIEEACKDGGIFRRGRWGRERDVCRFGLFCLVPSKDKDKDMGGRLDRSVDGRLRRYNLVRRRHPVLGARALPRSIWA